MKNYSDRDLSLSARSEVSVLAKGLGFSVTPVKIPIADIITATETAIKQGKLDHSKVKWKIYVILCNAKLPSQNITKEERNALGDLTKDKNIVLVPADKGKCVVVLNKSWLWHQVSTAVEGQKDLSTIFALIDHSPVGRIHSEEWA